MNASREAGQGRSNNKKRVAQAARSAQGRATDQDLPLKIEMRRLLWRMGCSTRLDVRLRAYVPKVAGMAGAQDITDLDVLGVGFTPGGQLHTTFADCRSNSRGAMERMFWVRGVADFVDADDAYMVRAGAVPPGARTLAARLGVGVVTNEDFTALEKTFPIDLDLDGPLGCLFDRIQVGLHLDAHVDAHPGLAGLLDYLEFDYWIFEPYRNLTQLVAHLQVVTPIMDPANPRHRTLLYDCAWHYVLAIARAVAYVRSTRASDVPTAVRTYVGGGEHALREKAGLARLLTSAGVPVGAEAVLPPYLDALTDLVGRHLVRPSDAASVLRYTEYLAVSEVNRVEATIAEAFGAATAPIAAKLVADTCGFLVTAAGLRPEFKLHVRERTVVDLTGGTARSAADLIASTPHRGQEGEVTGSNGRSESETQDTMEPLLSLPLDQRHDQ